MPLFKKINVKIGDETISISVNVDNDGKFWFQPNRHIVAALKLEQEKVYFDKFSDANKAVFDIYRRYRELKTSKEFFIFYRVMLSESIKQAMPDDVISDGGWKKTKHWDMRFDKTDSALIIRWFPLVKITIGNVTDCYRLRVPTDDDFETINRMEKWWLDIAYSPEYPFNDDFFMLTEQREWFTYEREHWFEVPLTRDTLAFFQSVTQDMVKLATMAFSMLNKEPKELMAAIEKTKLEKGNIKGLL